MTWFCASDAYGPVNGVGKPMRIGVSCARRRLILKGEAARLSPAAAIARRRETPVMLIFFVMSSFLITGRCNAHHDTHFGGLGKRLLEGNTNNPCLEISHANAAMQQSIRAQTSCCDDALGKQLRGHY